MHDLTQTGFACLQKQSLFRSSNGGRQEYRTGGCDEYAALEHGAKERSGKPQFFRQLVVTTVVSDVATMKVERKDRLGTTDLYLQGFVFEKAGECIAQPLAHCIE